MAQRGHGGQRDDPAKRPRPRWCPQHPPPQARRSRRGARPARQKQYDVWVTQCADSSLERLAELWLVKMDL